MTQESANVGRHLNSKKTKIVTTKEIYSFNIDNEDLEVVQDLFTLVESSIQQRLQLRNQEKVENEKHWKNEERSSRAKMYP